MHYKMKCYRCILYESIVQILHEPLHDPIRYYMKVVMVGMVVNIIIIFTVFLYLQTILYDQVVVAVTSDGNTKIILLYDDNTASSALALPFFQVRTIELLCIAWYWLIHGTDSSTIYISENCLFHNRTKLSSYQVTCRKSYTGR